MLLADGVQAGQALHAHHAGRADAPVPQTGSANPLKRWKLSYEDFRQPRTAGRTTVTAIEDMMEKTSGAPRALAPPAGQRRSPTGRLAALRIVADRLTKGVSLEPRPLDPKVIDAAEVCSVSAAPA